jgi:hypothetical protein
MYNQAFICPTVQICFLPGYRCGYDAETVIDEGYSLEQVADAYRCVEIGHKKDSQSSLWKSRIKNPGCKPQIGESNMNTSEKYRPSSLGTIQKFLKEGT